MGQDHLDKMRQKQQGQVSQLLAVKHRCGHTRKLKEIEQTECPACQKDIRKRRGQARQRKQQKPWPHEIDKLPHDSTKTITWNAASGVYEGVLTVPQPPPELLVSFKFTATGEKGVCHGLHRLYLEWLARQVKG